MNEARKQILQEGIRKLNGRLRQLRDIQLDARSELDCLPMTDEYEDLRDYLTDTVDDLDEAIVEIYFLIKKMEITLSTTIPDSPTKEEYLKQPEPRSVQHESVQPVRLKLIHELMLSVLADRAIREEKLYYEKKKWSGNNGGMIPGIGKMQPAVGIRSMTATTIMTFFNQGIPSMVHAHIL